ncbi:MAG TPA: OmpW family outer membrane protein [Candidatus Polarisedimenticolaceae bacterium]|nr:OmpW family outer membrane protein [Candidatus Polarisedimenticolaceae bacterium]
MSVKRALALVSFALIGAAPAFAQGTHFKLYGGAAYVAPLSESDVTVGSVTDSVKAEKQVGWNVGAEVRLGKLIGIELDYIDATQDVKVGGATLGHTTFSPFTGTVNFHLLHSSLVDLYLGPSYSYVNWGNLELNQQGQAFFGSSGLGTDSESAWGAAVGLDIGFGKHFAITGGLRYLDVKLQASSSSQSVAVNPLIGRLGVAVRF